MIILDATTKSLEIILSAAATTSQLQFTTSYVDITSTAFVAGEQDGISNNTTAVTVMSAPAASTQRQLKLLTIYNADTVSSTVTVRYNNNGTARILCRQTLSPGMSLVCDVNGKFYSYPDVPYLWWAAKISQTSTSAPTVDAVMPGSTLNTPTFARTGTGTYTITLTGAFTLNKTFVKFTNGESAGSTVLVAPEFTHVDVNTIQMVTRQLSSGVVGASDARLTKAFIKIYVYP